MQLCGTERERGDRLKPRPNSVALKSRLPEAKKTASGAALRQQPHSHFADHVLDLVQRQLVQRELPQLIHGAVGWMQTRRLVDAPLLCSEVLCAEQLWEFGSREPVAIPPPSSAEQPIKATLSSVGYSPSFRNGKLVCGGQEVDRPLVAKPVEAPCRTGRGGCQIFAGAAAGAMK